MNPNNAAFIANRIQNVVNALNEVIEELGQIRAIDVPDIPGYEYVGYSSSHNAVFQETKTGRLYEQVEGGLSPYVPVYDHTQGYGRVKREQ